MYNLIYNRITQITVDNLQRKKKKQKLFNYHLFIFVDNYCGHQHSHLLAQIDDLSIKRKRLLFSCLNRKSVPGEITE